MVTFMEGGQSGPPQRYQTWLEGTTERMAVAVVKCIGAGVQMKREMSMKTETPTLTLRLVM